MYFCKICDKECSMFNRGDLNLCSECYTNVAESITTEYPHPETKRERYIRLVEEGTKYFVAAYINSDPTAKAQRHAEWGLALACEVARGVVEATEKTPFDEEPNAKEK